MSGSQRPALVCSFSSCGERLVVRASISRIFSPRRRRLVRLGDLLAPRARRLERYSSIFSRRVLSAAARCILTSMTSVHCSSAR